MKASNAMVIALEMFRIWKLITITTQQIVANKSEKSQLSEANQPWSWLVTLTVSLWSSMISSSSATLLLLPSLKEVSEEAGPSRKAVPWMTDSMRNEEEHEFTQVYKIYTTRRDIKYNNNCIRKYCIFHCEAKYINDLFVQIVPKYRTHSVLALKHNTHAVACNGHRTGLRGLLSHDHRETLDAALRLLVRVPWNSFHTRHLVFHCCHLIKANFKNYQTTILSNLFCNFSVGQFLQSVTKIINNST